MATSDDGGVFAARVLQTGIALVHEGELVLPAAGSEAQAQTVAHDERATIAYVFPVEIEVRSIDTGANTGEALDRTFRAFAEFLQNR
jgi:hypothetical protein